MNIELLDYIEASTYILHVKTVRIYDDNEKTHRLYIDTDALVQIEDYIAEGNEEFYNIAASLRSYSQFHELIIWATSIADYDITDPKDLYRTPEKDLIWKFLIKIGIVELKDRHNA